MTKKTKKKRRKGTGKGSSFERQICKQLSQWWTGGKRTDVFWRTSGSGARAKTRSKTNRKTFGQYGDVQAIDPIGQPLIDLCTIEIKKGYSRQTIFDLVDKLPVETKQPYKKFIEQAQQDNANSESHHWLLITKRDYKETLVIMPIDLYRQVNTLSRLNKATPFFKLKLKIGNKKIRLFGTTLTQFFRWVEPQNIKDLIE